MSILKREKAKMTTLVKRLEDLAIAANEKGITKRLRQEQLLEYANLHQEIIADLKHYQKLSALVRHLCNINHALPAVQRISGAAGEQAGNVLRDELASTFREVIAAVSNDAAMELEALRKFHEFFRDRCEGLAFNFGEEAIDLYNAASTKTELKKRKKAKNT